MGGVDFSVGHIQLPDGFRHKDFQWNKLHQLWGGVRGGITVDSDYTRPSLAYRVIERLPSAGGDQVSFWYSRDVGSRGKNTYIDRFGLVGLSLIDYNDRSVLITEGVSDYLSAKMIWPERNVLGFTTLGGSRKARKIICSLFDQITYICDDDNHKGVVNTGLRAGGRVVQFYRRYGKDVRLLLPSVGYNDLTEEFMSKLRFL